VNDAGTDGLACVGLGIDQIRLRHTRHTRYRVPEMRCTVRQLMYRCVHETCGNERGSVQPHRENIIGVWVYTDCQSILHVFILTEVEGNALNCMWTQCAGCQSSTGGGGILTAGKKEKQ